MTTFRSCRLIVNRKLTDDRTHVCDFIDVAFLHWGGIYTLFWEWNPSKMLTIILNITLI